MHKKTVALLLSALLMVLSVNVAWAAPTVLLDGKTLSFEVPPTVENGRTLVPVRAIFEALGAVIYWDPSTQTITSESKGKQRTVNITIGNKQAYVNGAAVMLDVPASIIESRTMVPLRFVSEALGAQVSWDAKSQTIAITSANEAGQTTTPSGAATTGDKVIEIKKDGKVVGWYKGELKDGIPHGNGTFTAANGATYVGEFKDGIGEGTGQINFPDGSKYTGQVKNYVRDGQGEIKYKSGASYTGTFTNGYVTGTGTIIWPDGTTYTGEVVSGKPDGAGKLTSKDGIVTVGTFKEGTLVGN